MLHTVCSKVRSDRSSQLLSNFDKNKSLVKADNQRFTFDLCKDNLVISLKSIDRQFLKIIYVRFRKVCVFPPIYFLIWVDTGGLKF